MVRVDGSGPSASGSRGARPIVAARRQLPSLRRSMAAPAAVPRDMTSSTTTASASSRSLAAITREKAASSTMRLRGPSIPSISTGHQAGDEAGRDRGGVALLEAQLDGLGSRVDGQVPDFPAGQVQRQEGAAHGEDALVEVQR